MVATSTIGASAEESEPPESESSSQSIASRFLVGTREEVRQQVGPRASLPDFQSKFEFVGY